MQGCLAVDVMILGKITSILSPPAMAQFLHKSLECAYNLTDTQGGQDDEMSLTRSKVQQVALKLLQCNMTE